MSGAVVIKGDSEETIVEGFVNEMTLGVKTDIVTGFRGEVVAGVWAEIVGGFKLDLLLAVHVELVLGPKVEWFYSEYELREWKICNAAEFYEIRSLTVDIHAGTSMSIKSPSVNIAGVVSTTIESPSVNINSADIKLTSPTGTQLLLTPSAATLASAAGTTTLAAGASSVVVTLASIKCDSPTINLNAGIVNLGQPPTGTPTIIKAGGVNWKQVELQAKGCFTGAKTIIKSMT